MAGRRDSIAAALARRATLLLFALLLALAAPARAEDEQAANLRFIDQWLGTALDPDSHRQNPAPPAASGALDAPRNSLMPGDDESSSDGGESKIVPAQLRCPGGYGLCPNGRCCPIGSICHPNGSCCLNGSRACGSGCCAAGNVCYADGGCVPSGVTYCGNGRYCNAGMICTNGGMRCRAPGPVIPPGADNCGNGRYCNAGTRCHPSGNGCYPIGAVPCPGGKYCAKGSVCAADGHCRSATAATIPPGAQQCGNGRYCNAGTRCHPSGNGCYPVGAVPCPGGKFCPSGNVCTADGKCQAANTAAPSPRPPLTGTCPPGFSLVMRGGLNQCASYAASAGACRQAGGTIIKDMTAAGAGRNLCLTRPSANVPRIITGSANPPPGGIAKPGVGKDDNAPHNPPPAPPPGKGPGSPPNHAPAPPPGPPPVIQTLQEKNDPNWSCAAISSSLKGPDDSAYVRDVCLDCEKKGKQFEYEPDYNPPVMRCSAKPLAGNGAAPVPGPGPAKPNPPAGKPEPGPLHVVGERWCIDIDKDAGTKRCYKFGDTGCYREEKLRAPVANILGWNRKMVTITIATERVADTECPCDLKEEYYRLHNQLYGTTIDPKTCPDPGKRDLSKIETTPTKFCTPGSAWVVRPNPSNLVLGPEDYCADEKWKVRNVREKGATLMWTVPLARGEVECSCMRTQRP